MIGSHATGDVLSTDDSSGSVPRAGGLVGWHINGSISKSYATGNVTATNGLASQAGGLVGIADHMTIKNSYATGDATVTGWEAAAGGLVGTANNSTIKYSYATGVPTANGRDSDAGGLVGYFRNNKTMADNYWDTDTSGVSTSDGGAGKTTSELQSVTSASGIYENWDCEIWDFGSTSEYPTLRTEAHTCNTPASGRPTISGTAQVGETLTADTSGISDNNGLDNASYRYQWLADDAEVQDATGSDYVLAANDEGKAVKVRVSFNDDDGNAETLTSEATVAVAALPSPPLLTVSVENAAQSHDGQATFTFEIRFSEEFTLSYETLKSHAFEATDGTIKRAQRVNKPSNILWRITVAPSSNADVVIVLPETTDCNAQGAICTEDGRKLSNRLELTVSGPSQ